MSGGCCRTWRIRASSRSSRAIGDSSFGRREPCAEPPMGLLAERTHRCPLQCPYCANALELERAAGELESAEWCRVLDEAASLGALPLHLAEGEPNARRDLAQIVLHARGLGLST